MRQPAAKRLVLGVELAGYAAVTVGAFLVYLPAGFVALGAALLIQAGVIPTRGRLP